MSSKNSTCPCSSKGLCGVPWVTALLVACLFFVSAAEADELKVGAILPLSGPISYVGTAFQQGMELARDETIHIKPRYYFEDDHTADRVRATTAAKKLMGSDEVIVVFNAYVTTTSVVDPIAVRHETPVITLWDSNNEIPQFSRYTFGFGYSTELAGADMADFTLKTLQSKKIAIVSFHDEWSEHIADSFEKRVIASEMSLLAHEVVARETTDFRAILAKLRDADALYLPLYGPGLHAAVRQSRELGLKAHLLTADAFGEVDARQLGDVADGVYATQIWFDDAAFRDKFVRRFGTEASAGALLGYVALGYDAVMLLDALAGHSPGQSLTREAIVRSLPGFTFKGILGKTEISNNRTTARREVVLQVKNRSLRPANEVP